MTDDIDTQSTIITNSRGLKGAYQFCSRCGMLKTGNDCGFCKDLKRTEPKKKPYWIGRVRK
ncbi:MAG: hypothetical protein WC455_20025 [Dehalococcoidia bacterium]